MAIITIEYIVYSGKLTFQILSDLIVIFYN